MATPVILPKQGQSVESCLIVEWKKRPGDAVEVGDVLCEIETDKAVMEIESPAAGTLLATFFQAGDLAPVQVNIAAIGAAGEDASALRPPEATVTSSESSVPAIATQTRAETPAQTTTATAVTPVPSRQSSPQFSSQPAAISPRARRLADRHGIDVAQLTGSGPGGRIIERDLPIDKPMRTAQPMPTPQDASSSPTSAPTSSQPSRTAAEPGETDTRMSPVARAMVEEGSYTAPPEGSGPRGRVMTRDLQPVQAQAQATPEPGDAPGVTTRPLQGIRKRIAQRMRESLQASAQLTLHRTADARALQRLRALFKRADPASGLAQISINDLILFAVAQTLPAFPSLNARLEDEVVYEYAAVQLGFAVDAPRGLLVPVIADAQALGVRGIAQATKRLGAACQDGSIGPDALTGGTFTVTNLGSLGIESFTPILNPPQVAILGVGAIGLKPVESGPGHESTITFVPHLHLSLTIDHQVVDGAPGARFLQALAQQLATLDEVLLLAAAEIIAHEKKS